MNFVSVLPKADRNIYYYSQPAPGVDQELKGYRKCGLCKTLCPVPILKLPTDFSDPSLPQNRNYACFPRRPGSIRLDKKFRSYEREKESEGPRGGGGWKAESTFP